MENLIRTFAGFTVILILMSLTVIMVMLTIAGFGYITGHGFVAIFQHSETIFAGFAIGIPAFIAMGAMSESDL